MDYRERGEGGKGKEGRGEREIGREGNVREGEGDTSNNTTCTVFLPVHTDGRHCSIGRALIGHS